MGVIDSLYLNKLLENPRFVELHWYIMIYWFIVYSTPLKFNMEPKNQTLEFRRFRLWKPSFSDSMWKTSGVYSTCFFVSRGINAYLRRFEAASLSSWLRHAACWYRMQPPGKQPTSTVTWNLKNDGFQKGISITHTPLKLTAKRLRNLALLMLVSGDLYHLSSEKGSLYGPHLEFSRVQHHQVDDL